MKWFVLLLVLAAVGLPLGRVMSGPPSYRFLAATVRPIATRFSTATAVPIDTPGPQPTLPPLPPTRTPRPSPTRVRAGVAAQEGGT